MELPEDVRDLEVVGVGGQVARLDHVHPGFAVFDQTIAKRLAGRVSGADHPLDSLGFQEILQNVPAQLVGELESLDQALLFEFGEGRVRANATARSNTSSALPKFEKRCFHRTASSIARASSSTSVS